MAVLTIYLDENTIRSGNIEKVRRTLDPIVDNSAMIRRYEAGIALSFGGPNERRIGFFDLEKRLADPEHKRWFRSLDAEVSLLPYFLAVEEGKSSLLFYLMGVLDYRISDTRIVFNPTAAQRYFNQKKTEIKNLCLSNNIDPTPSIRRLAGILCPATDGRRRSGSSAPGPEQTALFPSHDAAPEPLPATASASTVDLAPPRPTGAPATPPARSEETQPLRTLLNRFGSIAVFKENRMTKLFLVFEDIPAHIHLERNELVHDRARDTWRFRTLFRTDGGERTVESLLLYRPGEVAESIAAHGGVLVMCIHRDMSGDYQKLFELAEPVPTAVVEEDGARDNIPVPPSEEPPAAEKPAAEPPPPDPKDRRIAELEAEVERLKKMAEAYEEAMLNRQKKSFFKKFFG